MKKLSVFFLAVAMTAMFAAPSFAMLRKDLQSVKGTVTYVNAARTEVTVKDSATGKDITFSSPGVGTDIVNGSLVVILYKTGTTVAKTVRVVVPRMKKAAGMKAASSSYAAPTTPVAMPAKKAW